MVAPRLIVAALLLGACSHSSTGPLALKAATIAIFDSSTTEGLSVVMNRDTGAGILHVSLGSYGPLTGNCILEQGANVTQQVSFDALINGTQDVPLGTYLLSNSPGWRIVLRGDTALAVVADPTPCPNPTP